MLKKGEIVYNDNLRFNGRIDDLKKRPCIVLFSMEDETGSFAYVCPTTKGIETFNNSNEDYTLISESIGNSKKLMFARLADAFIYKAEELHSLDMLGLSIKATNRIISKLKEYYKRKDNALYQNLEYALIFDELYQIELNKKR